MQITLQYEGGPLDGQQLPNDGGDMVPDAIVPAEQRDDGVVRGYKNAGAVSHAADAMVVRMIFREQGGTRNDVIRTGFN